MPTYEFFCEPCNAIDEVVRPMSASGDPYACPECGGKTAKHLTLPQVITKGLEIPYMHPAFGTVMTDSQAKAEAKRRGMIEVGNESLDTIEGPKRSSYDEKDYFL